MFNVDPSNKSMEQAGIPVSGSFEELVQECDIMLDSSARRHRSKEQGAVRKAVAQKLCSRAARRTK